MTFNELDLADEILEAISYMGFEKASPIQEQAIPIITSGHDLLACAQTGTGKTAAFMLPVLSQFKKQTGKGIKALIVVPTRELAQQIDQQIQGFSYFLPISSIAIYGGGDGKEWASQKAALIDGVDVVVATPGKLLSHLAMKYVKLDKLRNFILDEADRMLDMGFAEDLTKIISHLPEKRQNLLFSATMPPKIRELAKKMLYHPKEITLSVSKPAEGVTQTAHMTYDNQKAPLLSQILKEKEEFQRIIIFSSTKKVVFDLAREIRKFEPRVEGVSSDFDQKEREAALQRFTTKETRIIVATDVLSRGIDIKEIDLVINYDVPGNAEDYVHRVGRTARSAHKGFAITFINPDDCWKFHQIESLIGYAIDKPAIPEELGEAPAWKVPDGKKKRRRSFKQRHTHNKNKPKEKSKQGDKNKQGEKSPNKKKQWRKPKPKNKKPPENSKPKGSDKPNSTKPEGNNS